MFHPLVVKKPGRAIITLCLSLCQTPLSAQSETGSAQGPQRALGGYETRAQLIAEAQSTERKGRSAEAQLLRSRLQRGDFQEGDRIVVVLDTNPAIPDTLQVRAGRLLQIPRMSDFSLAGILRSELNDSLTQHLSRYIKNPHVRTTPLVPIAVMGEVRAPGYFYTPADIVLRDLIMQAGGPTGDADLAKVVIKRSGETIWNVKDVRMALSAGLSIDRLHMQAGDEVVVARRRGGMSFTSIATVVSGVTALVFAITQIAR